MKHKEIVKHYRENYREAFSKVARLAEIGMAAEAALADNRTIVLMDISKEPYSYVINAPVIAQDVEELLAWYKREVE